jgi:hypothetical protein
MEKILITFEISKASQAPVAHTCNPSYSGGRDQSQPGQIIHDSLLWKNKGTKKGLAQALWVENVF